MSAGEARLKRFDIELQNGQTQTSALYANGRHQCRVHLVVVKEVEDASGNWISTPLTLAEKEGATVTGYGGLVEPLPNGWHCDSNKNKFDAGLRPIGNEGGQDGQKLAVSIDFPEDLLVEIIPRFMRFSSGVPIDIQRFMGRITVGGKFYTTNGDFGSVSFNTYVDIQPTPPYRLRVHDLSYYEDLNAYSGTIGTNKIDIDVYYWTPPSGVSFVENRGLDRPVQVNSEGAYFQTSYIWDTGGRGYRKKGGIIWGKDTLGLVLRVDDVQRPAGNNPYIEFNRRPTIMRAIRYSGWIDSPNSEQKSPWRLWDNFGCEHVFYVDWADNRNIIVLKD